MSKKVLEGEIIDEHSRVSRRNNNSDIPDMKLPTFPGWRLLFCLVPIFGFIFSIIWYYYDKSKQRITIFPAAGIVIALFASSTFIVLRFILRAIF
jgi:hypothetical protein